MAHRNHGRRLVLIILMVGLGWLTLLQRRGESDPATHPVPQVQEVARKGKSDLPPAPQSDRSAALASARTAGSGALVTRVEQGDWRPADGGREVRAAQEFNPDLKYPWVRVEEYRWRDPATGAMVEQRLEMVGDHLLVVASDEATEEEVEAWVAAMGGEVRAQLHPLPAFLVAWKTPTLAAHDRAFAWLSSPGSPFRVVEHDHHRQRASLPNDPGFGQQWAFENSGQAGGLAGADIRLLEAWALTRGRPEVVVAVVDDGIDLTHPDLAPNLWRNPGEIANNNHDDDGNGYADDIHGWNFYDNNANVQATSSHGTHVAGVIGAVADNQTGGVGVAPRVKLMPIKFLPATGPGFTSDAILAIQYGTNNGAHLSNNSWGGGGYSSVLHYVIEQASQRGRLFVAAAGNKGSNNDHIALYPASYNLPNILAVAATDSRDRLATFSNYGQTSVHLAAPGDAIWSTVVGGGYGYLSGTSMAAPMATGAAALLLSANPALTPAALRADLMASVEPIAALQGRVQAGGRLQVGRALQWRNGAYLDLASVSLSDRPEDGASGNGNGLFEPGEEIAVRLSLRNSGAVPSGSLTVSLGLALGQSHFIVTQGTTSLPAIPPGATATQTGPAFRVQISPDLPESATASLAWMISDGSGRSWTRHSSLRAQFSSQVSGRVAFHTGGEAVQGATVRYEGSASGQVSTDALGNYTLDLPHGYYDVWVESPGYPPTERRPVLLPPGASGVDFSLRRPVLTTSLSELLHSQPEGQVSTHALVITNHGDLPAKGILSTPSTHPQPGANPDVWSPGSDFRQDFAETGLQGWTFTHSNSGLAIDHSRKVYAGSSIRMGASAIPAADSTNSSYTLPAAANPRQVSFWMRAQSHGVASPRVMLLRAGNGYPSRLTVVFRSDGRIGVNESLSGGDTSSEWLPGVWYRVDLRNLNWIGGQAFDFYLNGELRRQGIPLMTGVSSADPMTAINLHPQAGGMYTWIDEVVLADHRESWLSIDRRLWHLEPGESVTLPIHLDSFFLANQTVETQLQVHSSDPQAPVRSIPIRLAVGAARPPPLAQEVSATVELGEPITLTLGSPASNRSVILRSLPEHGELYETTDGLHQSNRIARVPYALMNPQMQVIYRATGVGVAGTLDSFQFQVAEIDQVSAQVTASVTLAGEVANGIPIVHDGHWSGREMPPWIDFDVFAQVREPDGEVVSVVSWSAPLHGEVSQPTPGVLRYVPTTVAARFVDLVEFTVRDPQGATARARWWIRLGPEMGGEWYTDWGNSARTSYVPVRLGEGEFVTGWKLPSQATRSRPVVMGSGALFAGGTSANITSSDLRDGLLNWVNSGFSPGFISGVTYADGRIYTVGYGGAARVIVLDASNGKELVRGEYPIVGNAIGQGPIPTPEGLFHAQGGSINSADTTGYRGVDPDTMSERFFLHAGVEASANFLSYENGELVYCAGGVLKVIDTLTGSEIWSLVVGPASLGSSSAQIRRVMIAGDFFVFSNLGESGSELLAVRRSTRSIAWRQAGTHTFYAAAPDRVYGIIGSNLREYTLATGELLREVALPSVHTGYRNLVVTEDVIFVAGLMLDRETLVPRLTVRTNDLAYSDGTLIDLNNNHGYADHWRPQGDPLPTAHGVVAQGVQDTPLVVTLAGSVAAVRPLVAVVTQLPATGQLYQTIDGVTPDAPITSAPARVGDLQRRVIFVPETGSHGDAAVTWRYFVFDGFYCSEPADVTVNLTPLDDVPRAYPVTVRVRHGLPTVAFMPAALAWDPHGGALATSILEAPGRGSLSAVGNGRYRYHPGPDFDAAGDSFVYRVTNPGGRSAQAIVHLSPVADAAGGWPLGDGQRGRNRVYAEVIGDGIPVEVWRTSIAMGTSPSVMSGRVLAVTQSTPRSLFALDVETGTPTWTLAVGGAGGAMVASPQQVAFVSRPGDDFLARVVSLEEGIESWRAWRLVPGGFGTVTMTEGAVHFGPDLANGVESRALDTGRMLSITMGVTAGSKPAALADRLIVHDRSELMAVDPTSGKRFWSVPIQPGNQTGEQIRDLAATEEAILYYQPGSSGGSAGALSCHDPQTGTLRWRKSVFATSPPVVAKGRAWVGSNGALYVFDLETGRVLYQRGPSSLGSAITAVSITDDTILLQKGIYLEFIDPASMTARGRLDNLALAAFADGGVLTRSTSGQLVYLRAPVAEGAPPVAHPVTATTPAGTSLGLRLSGADPNGLPLALVLRSLPAQGSLYQTPDGQEFGEPITTVPARITNPEGVILYEPAPGMVGPIDQVFHFLAHNGTLASAQAEVRVVVTTLNRPPEAIADRVVLRPGEVLGGFDPTQNDTDPDGDPLRVSSVSGAAKGTVHLAVDGRVHYAPDAGFTEGEDHFTYTISDGRGASTAGTVTVVMGGPTARDWFTAGVDPHRTGFQPYAIGSAPFELAWESPVLGTTSGISAPAGLAVVGSGVYTWVRESSSKSAVVALDRATGEVMWRTPFPVGSGSGITVHQDVVYVTTSNTSVQTVHALRVLDGHILWSRAVPVFNIASVLPAPQVQASGLWLASRESTSQSNRVLRKLDLATGQIEWETGQWQLVTPVGNGAVAYSFGRDSFAILSAASGSILWSLPLDPVATSAPEVDRLISLEGDRAFFVLGGGVGSASDQLVGVDVNLRTVLWTKTMTPRGGLAVAHGRVFGLGLAEILAYDQQDGRLLATWPMGKATNNAMGPIITHDAVIGDNTSDIQIFDLWSGALRQVIPHRGRMALANRDLVISDNQAVVRLFRQAEPAPIVLPQAPDRALDTVEDTPLAVVLDAALAGAAQVMITRLPEDGMLHLPGAQGTVGEPITAVPAELGAGPVTLIYVPPPHGSGVALGEFGYAVQTTGLWSAEGRVQVSVTPVNDPPFALDDRFRIRPGQILSPVPVTANDLDVDGDFLEVVSFTQPSVGRVVRNSDGTLGYHPPRHLTEGIATFSYTIADPAGLTSTATATIEIDSSAAPAGWTTEGGTPQRTYANPGVLGREPLLEHWRTWVGDNPQAPVLTGGLVITSVSGQAGGRVVALNAASGQMRWQRTLGPTYAMSPPTVHQGRVFAFRSPPQGQPEVVALALEDGAPLWTRLVSGGQERAMAPLVTADGVWVGNRAGLTALDPATGVLRWHQPLEEGEDWTPAAHHSGILTWMRGTLRLHSAATGFAAWSRELGWGSELMELGRSVTVTDSILLVLREGGATSELREWVGLSPTSGAIVWRSAASGSTAAAAADGMAWSLAGAHLHRHALADGVRQPRTRLPIAGPWTGPPIRTADALVIPSANAVAVLGSGDLQQRHLLAHGGVPVVAGDQLILTQTDGTLRSMGPTPRLSLEVLDEPHPPAHDGRVQVRLGTAMPDAWVYLSEDPWAPSFDSPSLPAGSVMTLDRDTTLRAFVRVGDAVSPLVELSVSLPDSDGDGIPDWWELQHFGDLTTAGLQSSFRGRISDRDAFLFGIDPHRDDVGLGDLAPQLEPVADADGSEFVLRWRAYGAMRYAVEGSRDLRIWEPLTAASAKAEGSANPEHMEYRHFHSSVGPRYLRVRVLPPLVW